MVQPSAESILETPQSLPSSVGGAGGRQISAQDQRARPDAFNANGIEFRSPEDDLYRQLRQKVEEGRDRTKEWRDECRESQGIAAGHQWDDDDLAVLRKSDRPEITFDRTGRNIDLLSGQEINNRDELAFVPREDGDVVKSEILSGAVQYINDETDSLDEVSDAFRDLIVTGMGWTETYMNYREFQGGLPQQVRRDPITMFWDPFATKRNLGDAEWVARVVSMPMATAMKRWPGENPAMLNAFWMGYQEDPSQPNSPERQTYSYDAPTSGDGRPPLLNRANLVEVQWYEIEDVVEMEDIYTRERMTVPRGRAQAIMHNIPGRFRGLPTTKNVYYTAVLGGKILSKRRMDVADGFTFQCMTGKRDSRVGWYGLVRAMKDPQKWANKWLSQSMHVMNRNAKGGVVAEEGAFVDPVKAEAEWGQTGSFTWAEPGAVTEGRFKEKEAPSLPNTLHQLMPVAMDSIQSCPGIPQESLGASTDAAGNKSALFEHQRREAGLMIVSPFFDAKRLHTKRQGRIQLRFILRFMNDGRLVQIVEEGQKKFVPLLFQQRDALKYDVIVSDAPDSPNQRTKTWSIIERLMPFIAPLDPGPEFWMTIVRASPLPSKVQSELIGYLGQQQEEAEEGEQEQMDAKDAAAMAKVPAEIQKLAAEAKRLAAATKELETQAMLNMSKIKTEQAQQTLAALEGVRETVAVQDAREAQKLTVHENA